MRGGWCGVEEIRDSGRVRSGVAEGENGGGECIVEGGGRQGEGGGRRGRKKGEERGAESFRLGPQAEILRRAHG